MYCSRRSVVAPALAALIAIGIGVPVNAQPPSKNIILATTTSTQNSGLLDVLLPVFQKQTGYRVKPIAVGSGQALAMGARGEADVLLVHSPEAEGKLMAAGHGVNRTLVMHNDFVIVGPPGDPARIRSTATGADAFRKIAAAQALFVSRGDQSGTHTRELAIWKAAGTVPVGVKWYQETGLGMGQTLGVAGDKQAYTLVDRGTWLALRKRLALEILAERDRSLLNVYHVITVNPARFPKANGAGAEALSTFLVSPEAQAIIAKFGVDRFGAPLFQPDAGRPEEQLGR